jgi:nickel-dependent lactate racemase
MFVEIAQVTMNQSTKQSLLKLKKNSWTRSSELKRFQQTFFFQIYCSVKDIKIVVLLEKGHQHDAEEEKEKKIQGFSTNRLLRSIVHQNLGNCIGFMLRKVGIHSSSNDLRRNL